VERREAGLKRLFHPRELQRPMVLVSLIWGSLILVLLTFFCARFDPSINDSPANLAWIAAVLLWSLGLCFWDPPIHRPRRAIVELWPVLLFSVVFVAIWLPFYDNWRWIGAGDTLPWFQTPYDSVQHGLSRSLFSIHGIWDHFTYTQVIVSNALMFVIEPTFFWHRVSRLVINLAALISIYLYFAMVLRRGWAIAVVVGTAANFVWIVFSYLSYNHTDSHIFAFLALASLTALFRQPDRPSRALALGLVSGFSLFFTQTAWEEIAACGIVFAAWAAARRRVDLITVCGISFVLAGLPVLMQLRELIALNSSLHAQFVWDWPYLWRIFTTTLWLPYGPGTETFGWGAQFFLWPCGPVYQTGLVIAACSLIPPLRRSLRLPAAVPVLFLLFAWAVVLMTLTNQGYSLPSAKRTYHLVPFQVFLCVLPFYTTAQLVASRRLLHRIVVAATVVVLGGYVLQNVAFLTWPPADMFGGTLWDVSVQLRQRYPDRQTLIVDNRPSVKQDVEDEKFVLNVAYRIGETIAITPELDTAAAEQACEQRAIMCYNIEIPEAVTIFKNATRGFADRLHVTPLQNSFEIKCFECGYP
jgi:hypothetical protein